MAQVIEDNEAGTYGWEQIEFSVKLPDLEQVVITTSKSNHVYTNTGWVKDITHHKFRVARLGYNLSDNNEMVLKYISGNFFTKANRVGARDSYATLDKETIEQLPDSLHDYARKHFEHYLTPMLEQLIKNGVVINA